MKIATRARLLVCIAFAACLIATPAADAQSWQWHVLVPVPGHAPVQAQSNVVLSAGTISMVYSARIENRETPITWCHAGLADVANAQALTRDGHTFLRLQLKPQRSATCDSGNRPFAFTRIADDAAARDAVSAINRAVGTNSPVAVTTVSPSPAPAPSAFALPSASPAAVPSTSKVVDWVDNAGLFTFIRVRNRSREPVMIATGDVENCRNVDFGCGRFPNGNIALASGAAATVATVMSNGQGDAPTFTYRYDVQSGALHVSAGGSSGKAPAGWHPAMSSQEMRSAEAVAIAGYRALTTPGSAPPPVRATPAPPPPPPAFVDARLTHRGSSRLGIGQKGVALVRVIVSGNGMPQDASIVKISNRQLVAAALETAVSSTYAPAMRNGRPVDGTYIATFTFDGDDPALSSIPMWKRDPSPAPSASGAPAGSPAP